MNIPVVSRETQERLKIFVDLLLKWNQKINLVSRKDISEVWSRHVVDSLQLVPFVAGQKSFIDLGSGGGFPAIIVAIATNVPAILIESDQRKAAFLREAARATQAPAKVIAQRIENVSSLSAPIITARALASLSQLLEWSMPFIEKNGKCIFLKGGRAEKELSEARKIWSMDVCLYPSQTSHDGNILEVSNFRRV